MATRETKADVRRLFIEMPLPGGVSIRRDVRMGNYSPRAVRIYELLLRWSTPDINDLRHVEFEQAVGKRAYRRRIVRTREVIRMIMAEG